MAYNSCQLVLIMFLLKECQLHLVPRPGCSTLHHPTSDETKKQHISSTFSMNQAKCKIHYHVISSFCERRTFFVDSDFIQRFVQLNITMKKLRVRLGMNTRQWGKYPSELKTSAIHVVYLKAFH